MSMLHRRETSLTDASDISRPTRQRRPTDTSMRSDETFDSQEWEDESQGDSQVKPRRSRKKADEPMSPLTVVFYVTTAYLIFQLLTRSDDLEILSHLPPTSSLMHPFRTAHGGANLHSDIQPHTPYALPYSFPHISSPIPQNNSGEESSGFFRIALGVIFYPVYLLVTAIAMPVPIILNILYILLSVLHTVLYPAIAIAKLSFQTFVLTPYNLLQSIMAVFYPIYTFVGAVVGVGCVMGLGVGWVGRVALDWILGKKDKSKRSSQKTRLGGTRSTRSNVSRRSTKRRSPDIQVEVHQFSDSGSGHEELLTPRGVRRSFIDGQSSFKGKGKAREVLDVYEEDFDGDVRATAREPHVVGTRRRAHRFGER